MSAPILAAIACAAFLTSCGSAPEPPPAATTDSPKPHDESSSLPTANLIGTRVVNKALLGKAFMPGGTVGSYKNGKAEYEMFIAKLPSAMDAAILLPDWRKALANAKLIPSFGGYFGTDEGRPVFVFTKNAWIAGVAGLSQKDADAQARILAAQLR